MVKKFTVIFSILLGIFITLSAITNVSTDVTIEDEAVFRDVLRLNSQTVRPQSFDDEIKIIRLVQQRVLHAAPVNNGIPEFEAREPADVTRLKAGLCYDRSRSIDKALKFLGFQTRHIYLLYAGGKSFLSALITYRQPSHAVTEVKTSLGWNVVDSNSAWISLAKNGTPIPADQIWQRSGEFSTIPGYFKSPFWAIRGLYSRKGLFYRPFMPFPDLNWRDFLTAFVE